jgi:hypothetical protein
VRGFLTQDTRVLDELFSLAQHSGDGA